MKKITNLLLLGGLLLLGAGNAWGDNLTSLYVRASFIGSDWSPQSMTLSTTTGNRIWSLTFTAGSSAWGQFQLTPSNENYDNQIGATASNIPITLEKKFSGDKKTHADIILIVTANCEYTIYYDETANQYWAEATSPAVVYFYNTLGWTEIYLHLDAYWNDNNRGAGNSNVWNRNYSMVRVGETNYWMCKFTGSHSSIAFTNASKAEAEDFYDVAAIYRSDFGSVPESPVYVPCTTSNETKKDGHTTYYNNGAWISYDATSFSRSLAVGRFGTICAPVNATISGAVLYKVAGRNADKTILYLEEQTGDDATTLTAGYPYFYKATDDAQTITLNGSSYASEPVSVTGVYGTYSETSIHKDENYCVLSNNTLLNVTTEGVKVKANRVYINKDNLGEYTPSTAPGRPIIAMPLSGNDATFIDNIEAANDVVKFIENGQLLILKNGVVYDVTGRIIK